MKNMIAIMLALSVLVTVPVSLRAEGMPQAKVEYSADSTMEAEGMVMMSRVYHTANKERFEMTGSGMNSVMISRLDRKIAWMLMPEQKSYMEMDLKEAKKNSRSISDCRFNQKTVGSDLVNGVKTGKYKITMTCPDSLTYDGLMWVSKDGIMMKMDAVAKTSDGDVSFKLELSNVKIGRQDPKLFEVPVGYHKMSMGGMFGGAFSGEEVPPPTRSRGKAATERNEDVGAGSGSQPPDDDGSPSMDKIKNFLGF